MMAAPVAATAALGSFVGSLTAGGVCLTCLDGQETLTNRFPEIQ
jgi:hypothetical protein